MANRANLARQVKLFSKRLLANVLSLASIIKYHLMAFCKFGEYLTLDKCLAKNCKKIAKSCHSGKHKHLPLLNLPNWWQFPIIQKWRRDLSSISCNQFVVVLSNWLGHLCAISCNEFVVILTNQITKLWATVNK